MAAGEETKHDKWQTHKEDGVTSGPQKENAELLRNAY